MKKILLTLAALVAVTVGVVGLAAGEAHIINVTAHIENALNVHPNELSFNTVFPQQYKELDLRIEMSESFIKASNADDIEYKIVQKPKCSVDGQNPPYYPVDRITHGCPIIGNIQTQQLPLLCPYLSKLDGDPEDKNDEGVLSYYVKGVNGGADKCNWPPTGQEMAIGRLAKSDNNDLVDLWKIDLKVPPFKGYVAQDWPANCPVLDGNPSGTNYGCDLWIETTKISEF